MKQMRKIKKKISRSKEAKRHIPDILIVEKDECKKYATCRSREVRKEHNSFELKGQTFKK